MKIVLLGPDGQVGWELQRALAPLGEVTTLRRESRHADGSPLCGDLAQPEALAASLRALRPDVVVNAGAYTAVDKAESEPALARSINALAPGAVAGVVAELGSWLLHFSTDYVFDGSGEQPRNETAATGPLSVYGRTKLEGEDLIRASGCQHLILRTSWVYGARGGNFARTMLKLALERERLTVIADQIGVPTGADLLADITAHALRYALQRPDVEGTYHAVAQGETSWHGYASHVIAFARALGQPIKVQPEAIEAVPTSAFPTPARRPNNSRMDTHKLRSTFDLALPPWQAGVERMLTEVLS